jgi:hypothetical protein
MTWLVAAVIMARGPPTHARACPRAHRRARRSDYALAPSCVLACAHVQNGQLGHGDNVNRNRPTIVEQLKGKFIAGGGCWGWGWGLVCAGGFGPF